MTHHYADLGSASETHFLCSMTNQKHYPYLGSDMSSVWNYFSANVSQTSFHRENIAKTFSCFVRLAQTYMNFFLTGKIKTFLTVWSEGGDNGEKNTSKKLFQ